VPGVFTTRVALLVEKPGFLILNELNVDIRPQRGKKPLPGCTEQKDIILKMLFLKLCAG